MKCANQGCKRDAVYQIVFGSREIRLCADCYGALRGYFTMVSLLFNYRYSERKLTSAEGIDDVKGKM